MKRTHLLALFLLLGTGCMELKDFSLDLSFKKDAKTEAASAQAAAKPRAPVAADEVTEANCYDMAKALEAELDRENPEDVTPDPPPKPAGKT